MNRISEIRKGIGISQQHMATLLNWSQSRLANYENNYRKPSLEDSRKIVQAFNELGKNCNIDDVFPPNRVTS